MKKCASSMNVWEESMSLDDRTTYRKIKEWEGFQEALRNDDREHFKELMNRIYRYAPSIEATPDYEQDYALLLSLLFDQHKTLERLKKENEKLREKAGLS